MSEDHYLRLLQEGLALLALNPQNARAAVQRFDEAKLHAPAEDGVAWLNAGVVLDQLGEGPAAEASFREGAARDPDHHGLRTNLAYVTGRRDPSAGILEYEALLTRWPDDAVAWTNLGTLYERTGQRVQAIRAYERALALDPALDVVAERLAEVRGGS